MWRDEVVFFSKRPKFSTLSSEKKGGTVWAWHDNQREFWNGSSKSKKGKHLGKKLLVGKWPKDPNYAIITFEEGRVIVIPHFAIQKFFESNQNQSKNDDLTSRILLYDNNQRLFRIPYRESFGGFFSLFVKCLNIPIISPRFLFKIN